MANEGDRATFNLQWHLTPRCDQHCKHCYMYDDPSYQSELRNQLSTDECFAVLDDFTSLCTRWGLQPRINFTGGDPLLRGDFFKILDAAASRGVFIGILGNPYHVNAQTAERLAASGVQKYQVSIDGDRAMHDFLRKPGSLDDTLRALRVLKAASISTDVMFTLSKANKGDLLEVIRIVNREGVDSFNFARLAQTGTGKTLEMLSAEEYHTLLYSVFEEYLTMRDARSKTRFGQKDHLWRLLYDEIGIRSVPDSKLISGGCGAGIHFLTLLADGSVYACRRFPSRIGKVPDEKLGDIFIHSPLLRKFRRTSSFKKCSQCKLALVCRGCPAVAYGINKDPFGPDPQCWRRCE